MSKAATSVAATAPKGAGKAAAGTSVPATAPNGAAVVNGSPAPEPVNGEVAPPASNRVTARSDRQPANVSVAQLALQMSKRSGERAAARGTRTTPAATSRTAPQAEAETPAEEAATEQVEEADAGVNESTELAAENAGGDAGAPDGAAPEGADLEGGEQTAEEPEAEVLPKNVKDLQARVNKLTARAKTAEARLAELDRTDTTNRPNGASARDTAHPELQQIEAQLAVCRAALTFADNNPDGGEYVEESGKKRYFDAGEVRAMRRNAEELRQSCLSDRAVVQRQVKAAEAQLRQQDQAAAVKAYPWLNKPTEELTPGEQTMVNEFHQILQMQPSLKQAPDYVSWIADAVAGRQARLARATARSASGATTLPNPNQRQPASGSRTPPQVVTRTAAAAPKVNPAQATVKAAEEKFRKTGNAKDYEKLLSAKASARRVAV